MIYVFPRVVFVVAAYTTCHIYKITLIWFNKINSYATFHIYIFFYRSLGLIWTLLLVHENIWILMITNMAGIKRHPTCQAAMKCFYFLVYWARFFFKFFLGGRWWESKNLILCDLTQASEILASNRFH